MEEAAYVAFLARACRGLFDNAADDDGRPITPYQFIREHLPLAQGYALIHAAAILEENVMNWPDPQMSRRGRWWLRVRQLFRRGSKEQENTKARQPQPAPQENEN